MTRYPLILLKKYVHKALKLIQYKQSEHQILIIRLWNEWAEGNLLCGPRSEMEIRNLNTYIMN